jgi:hypothetical protein
VYAVSQCLKPSSRYVLGRPKYLPQKPVHSTPKPAQSTAQQARSVSSNLLPEPNGGMCTETEEAKGYEDRQKKHHDRVAASHKREGHYETVSVRDYIIVEIVSSLFDEVIVFPSSGRRSCMWDDKGPAWTEDAVSHLIAPKCPVQRHRGVQGFHHLSAAPPPPPPGPMTVLKKLPPGPSPP